MEGRERERERERPAASTLFLDAISLRICQFFPLLSETYATTEPLQHGSPLNVLFYAYQIHGVATHVPSDSGPVAPPEAQLI